MWKSMTQRTWFTQIKMVSNPGQKYIMFLIDVDSNYISFEPMKSKENGELIQGYQCIIDRLAQRGIKPRRQLLDNEAPKKYLNTIKNNGIEWELAPLHNHRQNLAEKAIQIGKAHIISNSVGCDPSFPLWEWHRLLPQMEMTVNMLCTANATPTISAHTYLNGLHDYNKEPLAPLGCVMQCNVVPDEQTSFGPQSLYVWYIITSTENYLLYQPKPVNHPSCLNASLSGH